jgi:hypothetical protein
VRKKWEFSIILALDDSHSWTLQASAGDDDVTWEWVTALLWRQCQPTCAMQSIYISIYLWSQLSYDLVIVKTLWWLYMTRSWVKVFMLRSLASLIYRGTLWWFDSWSQLSVQLDDQLCVSDQCCWNKKKIRFSEFADLFDSNNNMNNFGITFSFDFHFSSSDFNFNFFLFDFYCFYFNV